MKPSIQPLKSERIQVAHRWDIATGPGNARAELLFTDQTAALDFVTPAWELAERRGWKVSFLLSGAVVVTATVHASSGSALTDQDFEALSTFDQLLGDEGAP